MPDSITLLRKRNVSGAYWKGSQLDILLGLNYLRNKNRKKLVLFGEPEINNNYSFNQIVQNTHLYFNFNNGILTAPIGFREKLIKSLNDNSIRFGVLPVFLVGKQFESAHSNILFFDFRKRKCERFEPYGFSTDETKLDTRLRKIFSLFGMKYKKPMKNANFQEMEEDEISMKVESAKIISNDPGGYCAAWCIWYVEQRLKYPKKSREDLVEEIKKKIENLDSSIRTLIRNYANNLTRIRKRTLRKKGLGSKRTHFSKVEQIKKLYQSSNNNYNKK